MNRTSDPQHELFDILDADGNPTGEVKARGLVHRDGAWHRGLHVWVYGIDGDGKPFVLFQRRSMGKDTWPGKLDVAVGGHFGAGEALSDTLRETEEEIGLVASADELIPLGRRFIEDFGATYTDRELDEVYALRCDRSLEDYVQHPEEVDGVVAIGLADLDGLFQGRRDTISAREVQRDGATRQIDIRMEDFAGNRVTYRNAAVKGIQALVNREQPQPFVIRE